MSAEALLSLRNVGKTFGGFTALRNVSVDVAPGERLGLIGPNGAGKSTLMSCISGTIDHDTGSIIFVGTDVGTMQPHSRALLGMARTFQIPRPFTSMSVLENLVVPFMYLARPTNGDLNLRETKLRCFDILCSVGLENKADEKSHTLTQIDLRKLELARAMAMQPKLLICDEVMAGLAHHEVDEILNVLRKLNAQNIAVIMIEHIIRAVSEFSERILVLVAGEAVAIGAPNEVFRNPAVTKAYLGS